MKNDKMELDNEEIKQKCHELAYFLQDLTKGDVRESVMLLEIVLQSLISVSFTKEEHEEYMKGFFKNAYKIQNNRK